MSSSDLPDLIQNRYRPLSEIGRGGMGRVLLVEDLQDDGVRRALKWVDTADPITSEETLHLREFTVLSRFNHPHIVRVHDFVRCPRMGGQFFTCEQLRGPDLSALVANGPIAESVGVTIFGQLLRAFEFLHTRGWVHGDVKPANVLLRHPLDEGDLDCCLIDFGLAQPENHVPGKDVVGTVYYIPPERVLGARMDRRGDLYALGVLMYHLLTGQLPFPGNEKMEVLEGHIRRTPPPPRSIRRDLSPELERILLATLAKKPADRPNTAFDILKQLRALPGGLAHPETRRSTKAYFLGRDCTGWEEPVQLTLGLVKKRLFEAEGSEWAKIAQEVDPVVERESHFLPLEANLGGDGHHGMVLVNDSSAADLSCFRDHIADRVAVLGVNLIVLSGAGCPVTALVRGVVDLLPPNASSLEPGRELLDKLEKEGARTHVSATMQWLTAASAADPFAVLIDRFELWDGPIFELLNEFVLDEKKTGKRRRISWVAIQYGRPGLFAGQWLSSEFARGWYRAAHLPALDAESMSRWIGARLQSWRVPSDLVRLLEEESEGSAALLAKLLGSMVDEGHLRKDWEGWSYRGHEKGHQTPLVRRTVRSIQQLEPTAQSVLFALEILGGTADPEWLRKVAGVRATEIVTVLLELQIKRWIDREVDGSRFRFRYYFQRKGIRLAIGRKGWREGNARVAAWLMEQEEKGAILDPERLANHLLEAADPEQAAEPALRAARGALRDGRTIAAIRWLERLVEARRYAGLPDVPQVLDELADLRERWGPPAEAILWRRQALEAAKSPEFGDRRFALVRKFALLEGRAGAFDQAEKMLRELLPALQDARDLGEIREALLALGELALDRGRYDDVDRYVGFVDDLPAKFDADAVARGKHLAVESLAARGRQMPAIRACRAAITELEAESNGNASAWTTFFLARRYHLAGRWSMARALYRLAAHQYGRLREPLGQARSLLFIGEIDLSLGLYGSSREFIERAQSLYRRVGVEAELPRLLWNHGLLLSRTGQYTEANQILRTLYKWARRFPATRWYWQVHLIQAEIDLRCGRLTSCEKVLFGKAHPKEAPHSGTAEPWAQWGNLAIQFAEQAGNPRKAFALLEEAHRGAREGGGTLGELPVWMAHWRLLQRLECRVELERLERRIEAWLDEFDEYRPLWDRLRGGLSENDLIEHGDEETLARYYLARARSAVSETEWSQALFLLEEAQHHARRALCTPLAAVVQSWLGWVRPHVFDDSAEPEGTLRISWKRLVETGVFEGRFEVLGLWARAREAAGDAKGAEAIRRATRRRFEAWTQCIPYEFDRMALAESRGVGGVIDETPPEKPVPPLKIRPRPPRPPKPTATPPTAESPTVAAPPSPESGAKAAKKTPTARPGAEFAPANDETARIL